MDQRPVHLDEVRAQLQHVAQRGVAGAGVIHGDAQAAPAQGPQLGLQGGVAVDLVVLGDLHDELRQGDVLAHVRAVRQLHQRLG